MDYKAKIFLKVPVVIPNNYIYKQDYLPQNFMLCHFAIMNIKPSDHLTI